MSTAQVVFHRLAAREYRKPATGMHNEAERDASVHPRGGYCARANRSDSGTLAALRRLPSLDQNDQISLPANLSPYRGRPVIGRGSCPHKSAAGILPPAQGVNEESALQP